MRLALRNPWRPKAVPTRSALACQRCLLAEAPPVLSSRLRRRPTPVDSAAQHEPPGRRPQSFHNCSLCRAEHVPELLRPASATLAKRHDLKWALVFLSSVELLISYWRYSTLLSVEQGNPKSLVTPPHPGVRRHFCLTQ